MISVPRPATEHAVAGRVRRNIMQNESAGGIYSGALYGLSNADAATIKFGLSSLNIHIFALPAGECEGS